MCMKGVLSGFGEQKGPSKFNDANVCSRGLGSGISDCLHIITRGNIGRTVNKMQTEWTKEAEERAFISLQVVLECENV